MAAKRNKATRSREHLGLLFVVVVLLCLWFARRVEHRSVYPLPVGTENGHREAAEPNAQTPTRTDHSHVAFSQHARARREMVTQQIEARGITDPNVLRAMCMVPRHMFVPSDQRRHAHADRPLPIGEGQTISQPYIVAFMTEALALDPNARVLEIGTGSGYQAAVCAEIAREVYTIEIVASLAQTASSTLKELGYGNVSAKTGDGYYGWTENGPFDAIIGTAAADRIPPLLLDQLKQGGRLILPRREESGFQYLVLVTKDQQGKLAQRKVLPVVFVPMTGRVRSSGEH